MKTTQPKKRGRPVGSKNKFKSNPFAKKYKEELKPQWQRLEDSGLYNEIMNDMIAEAEQVKSWKPKGPYVECIANKVGMKLCSCYYCQVKSWKRGAISETVNLTYIFLAFIIGLSLCAVVMTPILINAI